MRIVCALLIFCLLTACTSGAPEEGRSVDLIIEHAVVWTGETNAPDASVVIIDDGEIISTDEAKLNLYQADTLINLDGRFVMPGFMDNHVHFIEGGAALRSVDLRDAATQREFKRRIADYAGSLPEGRWVLNGNWDHTLWGGELPTRHWIDDITPNNPVFIIRLDGHMGLANSAALELAGISASTPDPDGGIIEKDASGEPTGLLKDNALNLVLAIIPPPSDDELMEQFSAAQDHALSLGLTKVHAVIGYPTETTMLDIFQMAQNKGLMKIRAFVSTPLDSWQDAAKASEAGRGDSLLSWGGVKGFVDGSLGSTTAWFHQPYTHDPSETGFPLNDPKTIRSWMKDADAAGLELSIHAIGDKAIDRVIDDFLEIGGDQTRGKRFRIEHFQHPTRKAITRAADAGIFLSSHPYHAIDDGRWATERIGDERAETTYAFRSILDAGGMLTFGSDWPVAPLSPIDGVYAAVTRRTLDGENPDGWIPAQKISVEEALTAYTSANAYAFGEEAVAGTIEAGKRADLIVLSADPRTVPTESIRDIRVLSTMIGGEFVYGEGAAK